MRWTPTALAVLALLSCAPPPAQQARIPGDPAFDLREVVDAAEATALDAQDVRAHAAAAAIDIRGLPSGEAGAARDAFALSDAELAELIDSDLGALGSLSMGRPNAGALINGVPFPEGERWEVLDSTRAFATQETIDYLIAAIDEVNRQFPGAHKLVVGHLSRQHGGPIRPHRSHQSGRDIDTGYYYVPEKAEWYRPATAGTLDLNRTWAFIRALLTQTDVEMILVDIRVQKLIKEHALAVGEDPEWLNGIFQYRNRGGSPIIKHAYGHRTHIHIRFFNPKAQRLGQRVYDALAARKLIRPKHFTVAYRARPGDSVAELAAKAGTSAAAIQRLNAIGADGHFEAGKTYYVPVRGQVAKVLEVVVPERRLPPKPTGARVRGVTASPDAP